MLHRIGGSHIYHPWYVQIMLVGWLCILMRRQCRTPVNQSRREYDFQLPEKKMWNQDLNGTIKCGKLHI